VLQLLHARAARRRLPEILSHVLRHHLHLFSPSLLSHLASSSASIRLPSFSHRLLLLSPSPDLPLFNAAIKSLSFFPSHQPFHLLSLLRSAGLKPDRQTFAPLLKSCSLLPSLQPGAAIHASALLAGFDAHAAVAIQLVELYAQFGRMKDAHKVFNHMPHREIVVWNLMINGFFKISDFDSAFLLFRKMGNRNVVTWNTMLAGITRAGHDIQAMELFLEMWESGMDPDEATIVTILPICARLGNSDLGRKIHFYAEQRGLLISASNVGNSLIDMYSKCGDLENARKVFDEMPQPDVVTWNTMINGLAINGHGLLGLQMFDEMLERCFPPPNSSTFVSVLGCCTHAGMVNRAKELILAMTAEYKIKPKLEHYGCLADLLGRCGRTREALELIEGMPMRPTAAIWGALLSACRNNRDVEVGEKAAKKLMEVEPENSGNFVLLANLYAEGGRWEEAEKVWSVMRGMRVWKNAARSAVGLDG
ncbi:pentatricopeptide repeat-containing protein At1g09190-like, partial [Phalaenopsis equestris]|uniref:pentatricopeptide repeat-containing protein At1g09190-like n=1 Tax=Phalaenopsis equestris TaxID=78828 RepID=UPI0009E487AC